MAEPGVDPSTSDRPPPITQLTVDGEVFDVRSERPGSYDYDWISGPNSGYGFSLSSSDKHSWTKAEHEQAIREFLTEINPETGYLD